MTREEEIRQAADKYVDNFGCKKKDTPVLSAYYLGYVAGAEWADEHPQKTRGGMQIANPHVTKTILIL